MKKHTFCKNLLLILTLLMLNISCTKEASATAPTNLQLSVQIRDDGSGRVDFVATASNADRYLFSFGQAINESIRSADGKAYTIYAESGTYTVKVIAYAGDKSIEITKQIAVDRNEVIDNAGYVSPENYPGMTLVWRDEFNGSSLDPMFWNFEEGNGTEGWGNQELQYYRKENTRVNSGYLTITAKKESFGGKEYTSSRITTEAKKDFLYGRIDFRAKLPKGQGIWPAFWALGANIRTTPWPFCGEIDVMEMVGGGPGKDNTAHGTVHYEDGGHKYIGGSTTLTSGDFFDKFHVFSLVWTERSLKWYVDNNEFFTFDTTGASKDEFRRSYFLLINLAVGGNWPGAPSASTAFPQKYIVDYVRVFQ
jgi:beta-glucanase (GH16 family)